jgi:LmbE family N-acetylglucosaminyl deacetylase
MGPGTKPVACDISDTIERKIEALLCHRSQVGEEGEKIAAWVRTWTAEAGRRHGHAHAETFQVISQGPGFHQSEQVDDVAPDLARANLDPRASRAADGAP